MLQLSKRLILILFTLQLFCGLDVLFAMFARSVGSFVFLQLPLATYLTQGQIFTLLASTQQKEQHTGTKPLKYDW